MEDPAFDAKIKAAQAELDRQKQATMWQALNKDGHAERLGHPDVLRSAQHMAGTKMATALSLVRLRLVAVRAACTSSSVIKS